MFLEKGFPPDWSTHKKLIWMKAASGGGLPWSLFSGNPLQFRAAKAHTLRSTSVSFTPIQEGSGDPSPENVRPISGWNSIDIYRAGENLCDLSIDYTASAAIVANCYIPFDCYCAIIQSSDYADGGQWRCRVTYKDGTYKYATKNGAGWTATQSNPIVALQLRAVGMTAGSCSVMLSAGASASPYAEPKPISTTTLSFPSTVYGGTASVAEDGTASGNGMWRELTADHYAVAENRTGGYYCRLFPTESIDRIDNQLAISNIAILRSHLPSTADKTYIAFAGSAGDTTTFLHLLIPKALVNYDPDSETLLEAIKRDLPISNWQIVITSTAVPFTPTVTGQPTAVAGINTMWTDGDTLTVEAKAEAVNNA